MRNTLSQRGAAAIEFAIVLLFLIPLAFGIAELGRAFYQYNTLAKATRDGVRWLAVDCTGNLGTARNFTTFGTPDGSGEPLVPGLSASLVHATCDQSITYVGGTFKAATMYIEGFAFKSLMPGLIDDIPFARIGTTMRQK